MKRKSNNNSDIERDDTTSFSIKLKKSLEVSSIRNYRPNWLIYEVQVLQETFRTYRTEHLFVSFNGGKDCTVLLHLINSVLRLESSEESETAAIDTNLLCLYFQPRQPFDEVEQFVELCRQNYRILVQSSNGASTKAALQEVCNTHPELKACLMGCRRTDPYCEKLSTFEVDKCTSFNLNQIIQMFPLDCCARPQLPGGQL